MFLANFSFEDSVGSPAPSIEVGSSGSEQAQKLEEFIQEVNALARARGVHQLCVTAGCYYKESESSIPILQVATDLYAVHGADLIVDLQRLVEETMTHSETRLKDLFTKKE